MAITKGPEEAINSIVNDTYMDQVEVQGISGVLLRDHSFHSALNAEDQNINNEHAQAEQDKTAASSKDGTERRRQAEATRMLEELRAEEVKAAKIRATVHAASAELIVEIGTDGTPSLISTAA